MNTKSKSSLYQLLIVSLILGLSACHIKVSGDGFRGGTNRYDSRFANEAQGSEPLEGKNIHKTNGSIVIAPGRSVSDVSTVNGRVFLDQGAIARSVRTVNGKVEMSGAGTVTENVNTVNGRISAPRGGNIGGSARTVNGRINLSNVTVGGNVGTSNGRIDLFEVSVGDSVETKGGDVRLENSIVGKDLVIHPRQRASLLWIFDFPERDPEIIIGPGSEIRGDLIARTDVRLFVHESASIGDVIGARPVIYSGHRP